MAWTCEQIEEGLSDYLDDLLGPAERVEFAAHLDSCARCAPMAAQVSRLVAGLHRLEPVEPPPQLVTAILDRTIGPKLSKKSLFGRMEILWQPRFVLGLATVAATLAIVFHSMGARASRPTLANLSPASVYRSADRHAHLAYARSVKFVNDLRLVYEIQSRLQTQPPPEPAPEPANAPGQQAPAKKSSGQVNHAIPHGPLPVLCAEAVVNLQQRWVR